MSSPAGRVSPWLWSILWPKLSHRSRASRGQKLVWLVFTLVGIGLACAIFSTSAWFLRLCFDVEAIGPLLCKRLLDLMLLALLAVLLLSNIVTALGSFFLSEDLGLLLTTPVPLRSLFGARFLEQIFTSSWMVVSFGLPVLLAFAVVCGTPLTYLAILGVLPPLLVFPAALGVLLTLLMVRFMPAARVRNLVGGVMFIGFITLYLMFRLARPEQFMNPEGFASLIYLLASLSSPSGALLPSHWGMAAMAQTFRDASPSQDWLLMLAALWTGAGACYVMASLAFRGLHAAAYSRSQEGRNVAILSRVVARLLGRPLPVDGPIRTPGRMAPAADWGRSLGRLLPAGASREFVIKDAKLLLRDASQWSQMVLLLALVFVYLYNFRHFRQIGDAGLVGPLALYLIGMALCGFVTTAVSVRFAFPLISLEGSMLWMLRTAPLSAASILRAKLISTLPPLLLMAEAMSVASSLILGVNMRLLALAAAVAGFTAVSVSTLAVGLGAVLPDFRAGSAAKVAASFGGLVCMSAAFLVALAQVFFSVYPAFVLQRGVVPRASWLVISAIGMMVVTLVSIIIPMRYGVRSLERLEP